MIVLSVKGLIKGGEKGEGGGFALVNWVEGGRGFHTTSWGEEGEGRCGVGE